MDVLDLSARIELDTSVSERSVKELTERVEMLRVLLDDTFHIKVDTSEGERSIQGLIRQTERLHRLLGETLTKNSFGSIVTANIARGSTADANVTDNTGNKSTGTALSKLNLVDLFFKGTELYIPLKLAEWGMDAAGEMVNSAAEQGLEGYGDFRRIAQEYMDSAQELQGHIDSLKQSIGMGLLPAVTVAINALNSLAGKESDMSKENGHTNYVYYGTAEEIEEAANTADYIIKALLNLETSPCEETEETEEAKAKEKERQGMKKAGLQELVDLIPGFADHINMQTWEVPEGISALSGYLTQWKEKALDQAGRAAYAEWNRQIDNAESFSYSLKMERDAAELELEDLKANILEEAKRLAKKTSFDGTYSLETLGILIDHARGFGDIGITADLDAALEEYRRKENELNRLNDQITQTDLDIDAAKGDEPSYVSAYKNAGGISEATAAQNTHNESFKEGIVLGEQAYNADYGFIISDWIDEQLRLITEGKESFAQIMTEAQTIVAEACETMTGSVTDMVASFNQSGQAYINAFATANGLRRGFAVGYEGFASIVGSYLSLLDELQSKSHIDVNAPVSLPDTGDGIDTSGLSTSNTNADGLSYVPYDDYLSYLHRGEAVLTAAQADDWRAGRDGMDSDSAQAIASAVASAVSQALRGVTVQMDGTTVGHLVADTVSSDIARAAMGPMRYIQIG